MPVSSHTQALVADTTLDASGLTCPMPLLQAKQALHGLSAGQRLHVIATDPGSARDIPAFCKLAGHPLLASEEGEQCWHFWIEKACN